MAVVANLAVAVTAKTDKFRQGMRRSSSIVQRFGGQVRRVGMWLGALGAAAIAAAVGGMAILTKREMAAIDATAKLADRIGITTQALVGLQHAAEITGAGTEVLNKGLMFMLKSLGEAKQGIGEVQYALKAMNLKYEDLIRLSPDQAFLKIAGAMAKLETNAERNYVATKLFGRAGQQLVNTLALGKEGIQALVKENERLYGSLTRIDAKKVEEANDAFTRMKKSVAGMARGLAVAFAPALTKVANALTSAFIWIRTELPGIVKTAFARILRGVEIFRDAFLRSFIMAEFLIKNWRTVVEMQMVKAALAIVMFANNLKHHFTVVVPAMAKYMVETLIKMGRNIDRLTINLGRNLVRLAANLPALISGKMKVADIWKPLTEGLTKTFGEIPRIAARGLTPLEKRMGETIERMKKNLAKNFLEHFEKRFKELGGGVDLMQKLEDWFAKFQAGPAFKAPPFGGGGIEAPGEARREQRPAALLKGTVEAYSAALKGGTAEKQQEKTTKKVQEVKEKIQETNEILRENRDLEPAIVSF